jgi:hypothetical protein
MSDDRLERALSEAIADIAGTESPDYLDDILERTSRTRQRPWWTFPGRYTTMTSSLKFAAAAGLAFVLGLGISPLIMPSGGGTTTGPGFSAPEQTDDLAFPTGTFVDTKMDDRWFEFHEDGFGRIVEADDLWEVEFTYATQGDLWTEMMTHYPTGSRQVPATYFWDFDGEHLTFELWGEDLVATRRTVMDDSTWTLVPDPRVVVVAVREIPAGDTVRANAASLRVLPATEVGPDAFTDRRDVSGYIAAVDIAAGQPLTPDLMEPPAE